MTGRFVAGIVLEPVGVAAVVGGIVAVVFALAGAGGGSEPNEPSPPSTTPGAVVIGLGAAAIIGGIALIAHDATTDVQQQNGAATVPSPSASTRPAPTWREQAWEERALPDAAVAPLWVVRF